MAFSETKINSSNINLVSIENYQFERKDSLSHAGGVGLYLRKDLQYSVRTDISIDCPNCENLFVEIMLKSKRTGIIHSNKSILVGVIYRHPGGSYADFQEKLTNITHKFNQSNTQLELVGDYNQGVEPFQITVRVQV